jgi:DHA1 family bicyclomycin/chloramphenicol resistance-like MFS transporter
MSGSDATSPAILRGMGKMQFIGLCAALMALNALAVDIMLPGLQQIGASLNVEDENSRQFVVTAYLVGFGIAQLFFGPVSDRFGRRKPLFFGFVVYILSAFAITLSPTFTALLALRFVQGIGSAATRVVTVSIIRDVYGGRQMAEVMSLIMMVFMVVPVIAPGTGQIILFFGNWHLIFVFIGVVGLLVGLWAWRKLPETLSPNDVRPFTASVILDGFKIVLSNRSALSYTLASAVLFGALFGFINSANQIYIEIYDLGSWFPLAFAGVALFMALSSYVNSRFVGRFGMRRLSHGALLGFIIVNAIWLIAEIFGPEPLPFPYFITLFAVSMFLYGWIGSNFNSLAMEPLGHVAGTASSVLGFTTTIGGAALGAAIGQAYDGTALPLVGGYCVLSIVGLGFVLFAEKGKLFRPQNPPVK